jgi:hypothetical protein
VAAANGLAHLTASAKDDLRSRCYEEGRGKEGRKGRGKEGRKEEVKKAAEVACMYIDEMRKRRELTKV